MIKQCVICGKEFSTRQFNQITCSEECREEYQRQWHREYHKKKYPPKPPKKCAVCGKEFIPTADKRVFCSPECRKINKSVLYQRKRRAQDTAKPKRIWEDITYQPICYTCGKSFTPSYPREHFCSDECRFQSPLWIHLAPLIQAEIRAEIY